MTFRLQARISQGPADVMGENEPEARPSSPLRVPRTISPQADRLVILELGDTALPELWNRKIGLEFQATGAKETVEIVHRSQQLEEVVQDLRQGSPACLSHGDQNGVKEGFFDSKVRFDTYLIKYEGNTSWIPGTLKKLKATLENENIPDSSKNCEHCRYFDDRQDSFRKMNYGQNLEFEFDE